MSETFIKINQLQHLEILRQTYLTNLSKICVTTFTFFDVMLIFQIMRTIHNLLHLLIEKH